MRDYQAQIEKLRRDAAECALIRDLATDKAKREMFDRLAKHLAVLADQVEMAMVELKNDTE
jgi:ribosomal protein S7